MAGNGLRRWTPWVLLALAASMAGCTGAMTDTGTDPDGPGDTETGPGSDAGPPASEQPAGDALEDPAPPKGPPPGTPADTPEGRYYDIVYVRAPRYGDDQNTAWPEVKDPIRVEPGTDLMLLHPDGSEEVLVDGGHGAVVDPVVSFDGKWVYYSKFPDVRAEASNHQRRDAPKGGADIYKINLQTRQTVRLTHQEWTPNTAAGNWADDPVQGEDGENTLGYGIFNLGPCPLPGGKVMFTSSRNGFKPNKSFTFPNLQLFVMDEDGSNVVQIGHLNLGSALHPKVLTDGRVMFSSYEAQGLRDRRLWGLWAIWPDGRHWDPLMSAFKGATAFHFHTQLSSGEILVDHYYNQNNNGFGTLIKFPAWNPGGGAAFGSPNPSSETNPSIQRGWWPDGDPRHTSYPFSPDGLEAFTAFTHGSDDASPRLPESGEWAGKVTHPTGAPHNTVLLTYSPGPANNLNRPTPTPYYDGGIYLAEGGEPVGHPSEMTRIKNSPDYNEQQPRPVVPYEDIYGIEEPFELTWLPNDGSKDEALPAGTPFGIVGTSSFYKKDTAPWKGSSAYDGLDVFNTRQNRQSSNWTTQGAEAGYYTNEDIFAVRVLAMEPESHRSYGPGAGQAFRNHANERLRILGEVPLRKRDEDGNVIRDPDGNPDTSFKALIPADVPFTFQTLDENGMVLNMSQTWHQVRPGEVRTDCGGCHAHSQEPTAFENTYAASSEYDMPDLAETTPMLTRQAPDEATTTRQADARAVDVEYYRDVKPILEQSCVPCHSSEGPAEAGLVLDDDQLVNGYDNTYNRLASDKQARWGIPPVIQNGTWRQTNASRYIRKFQSRRSLLVWKIFGRRLDGWSNEDHPTESVPGDPSTLPEDADTRLVDIDYTGEKMPPPDSDVPPLTEEEKMTIVRWIDLGCPITSQDPDKSQYGWFLDELRPTMTLSAPRPGRQQGPLRHVRVGLFDYYSGLDTDTLSVKADFELDGHPAGTELAPYFERTEDEYIWTMDLSSPLQQLENGTITVRVRDQAGNVRRLERTFAVAP